MKNLTLHGALAQFTAEAGERLELAASAEEIPFEVVERGGRVPLYCYRPLTGEFIRARLGLLTGLPSYAPAARAIEGLGGADAYLRARGERWPPEAEREQADAALHCLLARVFEERSDFEFQRPRFDAAYDELERALYQGRCVTEVVAPLLGLDLDPGTEELALGEGLSLTRPAALADAPGELAASDGPVLLLALRATHDRLEQPPLRSARARMRRALSALRLYERGGCALGELGWWRLDDGVWSALPVGGGGAPTAMTLIPVAAEDELRAFCSLIGRRLPGAPAGSSGAAAGYGGGEVGWALSRFELGCERAAASEALSDHLLALRALLEPEGPASGRLAQRLAVICAAPEERARLAERAARAIALERSVITGLGSESGDGEQTEALIAELGEHLRAILRDILCGHLDADVCGLADRLLAQAADEVVA